jgi:hypothetical protein
MGQHRSIRLIAGFVVLSAIGACTDVPAIRNGLTGPIGGLTPPTAYLASISVSLAATSATIGQSTKATVSGVDQYGKQFAPGIVEWSTTPEGLATVSSDGTVTTVAEGVATVWANKAGIPPGSASITISR